MNAPPGIRTAAWAVAVWAVVGGVYLADRSKLDAHDAVPARYLPYSLLTEGNADLTEFSFLYREGIPYYLQERGGRYYSTYPIGSAVAALPLYAGVQVVRGRLELRWAAALEKLSAALLAACSAMFVFLALAGVWPLPTALAGTAVYAFATNTWAVTSQAQWQHTSSQLFVAAALWALVRSRSDDRWAVLAGGLVSAAVACRPTNIAFAAAAAGYVAMVHRKRLVGFLAAALPFVALVAGYNLRIFGSLAGGYAGCWDVYAGGMSLGDRLINLVGLLVSPSRGMLIYTPVAIAAVPAMAGAFRRDGDPLDRMCTAAVLGHLAIVMQWRWWHGGVTFGPRLMNDVLPLLTFVAVPVLARWWRGGGVFRWLCGVLVVWSVAVQLIGVVRYDARWDLAVDPDSHPAALWDVRRSQLMYALRDGAMEVVPRRQPDAYRYLGAPVWSAEFDRHIGYGFGVAEPWGRWGIGRRSLVLVSFPDTLPRQLVAVVVAPGGLSEDQPQEIAVSVDGRPHARFPIPADGSPVRIAVPLERSMPGQLHEIVFRYRRWVRPARRGFGDARKLAVGFRDMRFEQKDVGDAE